MQRGLYCFLLGCVFLTGCGAPKVLPSQLIPPSGKYDVRILRDNYGVPHIFGRTDADTAYGLGYAHCEDDFDTIQEGVFLARGRYAEVKGKEGAPVDYLIKLFRFRELVEAKYDTDLAPETRAICEAYAEGFNHYAALHPDRVIPGVLPANGKDVVAGFVVKSPMFFGMDREVKRLFEDAPKPNVPEKIACAVNPLTQDLPIGSNTFAISPRRTPDGKTHLAINSHQPWTGPVAWYEAHMKSEEGLDVVGGVFPGCPVVLHGHNRNLGWAHTVNHPDLVDIYTLEMNPDNPDQYRFDGEWRNLEKGRVTIWVKLWHGIPIPVRKEVLYSVYGPTLRRPSGVYAIRYGGYGDIRQVEQWFRMDKAQNMHEFDEAMRMQAIPCFNVGYADKEGNIWYIYNARLPIRAEGYDWKQYLPGNTSKTLWTEYLPFEQLPQVKNPASGFIQNANSTPFRTTLGPENPKPGDFSPTLGIQPPSEMSNRALRLLELLGADTSITEEKFQEYKYDIRYSKDSEAAQLVAKLLAAPPSEDPVAREATELLRTWDLDTNLENPATAIAILTLEPVVRAELSGQAPPDLAALLKEKAHLLKDTFGRIDVPWKEVNRLVHGTVNIPLDGGPDTLHAVYADWRQNHLEGMAGDCYILLATWNPDGHVHSRSVHQFGSATRDPKSPHYADQAQLFADHQLKPVWMDEAEVRQHLEREYRPGE